MSDATAWKIVSAFLAFCLVAVMSSHWLSLTRIVEASADEPVDARSLAEKCECPPGDGGLLVCSVPAECGGYITLRRERELSAMRDQLDDASRALEAAGCRGARIVAHAPDGGQRVCCLALDERGSLLCFE